MPTYEHQCEICEHIFEDTYSINDPVPTTCPKCGVDGKVKRLISRPGSTKVELYGRELYDKLWKEGKDLAKQARTNENLAENLYGKRNY